MASKPTPAPWTREQAGAIPGMPKLTIFGADGTVVARLPANKANGCLIEAAPDMYAALAYAADNPEFDSAEFDRLVHAALKKARGGQ